MLFLPSPAQLFRHCGVKWGQNQRPACWKRGPLLEQIMLWTSLTHDRLWAVFGNTGRMNPGGSWDYFQQISLPRSEARSELIDGWLTYWPWQVPRGIEECAWKIWNFQRGSRWLRFHPHVRMMLWSEPVRWTACNVCLHDSITNKPHHISPVPSSFAILTLLCLFPFVPHWLQLFG